MIEILTVLPNDNNFSGYIRKNGEYLRFRTEGENITYTQIKGEYRGYEHFVGVMSKSKSWIYFLKEPEMVEELTPEVLSTLDFDGFSNSIKGKTLTIIPEKDKNTEPEGFTEWMAKFKKQDVFVELWDALVARKKTIKEQDKIILEYYICRACRDAQLAKPYYPTEAYGRKNPTGTTLRDKARKCRWSKRHYVVRFGQIRFKQRITQRCRPFNDPVLYGLILELALIIKSTLADMDISYACRSRIVPPVNNHYIQRYIPQYPHKPYIRFNILNTVIADLVNATFKKHNHPHKEVTLRRKNLTAQKVKHHLDSIQKKGVELFRLG